VKRLCFIEGLTRFEKGGHEMKKRALRFLMVLLAVGLMVLPEKAVLAADPIILGCPLSIAYLYGWDAERAIRLAVEEINAKGGVKVGGTMRPFQVEVMDTRDLEPGVPVSEALLAVEKLILEKKANFILGGPVRSEAALAAMPLLSKHKKVSILTTGVLTPKYHALVEEQYDKYKYCFRIHGEAKWLVKEVLTCLEEIKQTYGFNKLMIMVQDVAHARASGQILGELAAKNGWIVTDTEIYPTGTTDFSMGLIKAGKTGTQVMSLWMDMPESSILLKQWYDMKVPALPFGSTLCAAEQPGFWKATEGKGEFCLANVVNAGNAPSNATPWTMKFYNAYKDRWKIEPEGLGCSSSYTSVYVLKDAIEKAGTLESDAVVTALEQTNLVGPYGLVRFSPKGHQVIPSFKPEEGAVGSIFQWQAEKRVVVFPKSIAQGTIQLPPWMQKK